MGYKSFSPIKYIVFIQSWQHIKPNTRPVIHVHTGQSQTQCPTHVSLPNIPLWSSWCSVQSHFPKSHTYLPGAVHSLTSWGPTLVSLIQYRVRETSWCPTLDFLIQHTMSVPEIPVLALHDSHTLSLLTIHIGLPDSIVSLCEVPWWTFWYNIQLRRVCASSSSCCHVD